MATIFLAIIYVAFISLGLPDSLLGAAWPAMYPEYGVPLSNAGIVSMAITGGTVVSSLLSARLTELLGAGKVTAFSIFLTSLSMLGFSLAPSFCWLFILALPLGLGAGAVDVALNHFVAAHFQAKHMNWLHCCWGVGAMLGPVLMALFLGDGNHWRKGYFLIFLLLAALSALIFLAIPLWEQFDNAGWEDREEPEKLENNRILSIKGVKATLIAFFCYSAIETTVGLWGSSYLVAHEEISVETAAGWISFFYAGITAGRLAAGFVTMRLNNTALIRLGQGVCLLGSVIFMLPLKSSALMVGFILLGLGLSPIYPCLLHETPGRFGRESQSIMGFQMAAAYLGSTLIPLLFGLAAGRVGVVVFPCVIFAITVIMGICTEKMYCS